MAKGLPEQIRHLRANIVQAEKKPAFDRDGRLRGGSGGSITIDLADAKNILVSLIAFQGGATHHPVLQDGEEG